MKPITYCRSHFPFFIENQCCYVDKTEYLWKLITRKSPGFYFLSRPRRFGKSLTLSTLKALFQGKKELFEGLAIYDKYKWEKTYPVIHLNLSGSSSEDPSSLENSLSYDLDTYAMWEDIKLSTEGKPEVKLEQLINMLSVNGPVAVLIDEYDDPILHHLGDPDASGIIDVMRRFYGTLEKCKSKIGFVYITAIGKFCYDQIFADVPSLEDISMDPEFATMIGFTQKELETYFADYIDVASRHNKLKRYKFMEKLQEWYAGYRFHEDAEMVYNPVALVYIFDHYDYCFEHYWYATGSPALLADYAKRTNFHIMENLPNPVPKTLFRSAELNTADLRSIMYLTGYLTIRDSFIGEDGNTWYHVKFTNRDVAPALMRYLLSQSLGVPEYKFDLEITHMYVALSNCKLRNFIRQLKLFFLVTGAGILINREARLTFYALINYYLGEVDTTAGDVTNDGSLETVFYARKGIFMLEGWQDGTAQEALDQLEESGEWKKFLGQGKAIYLIGINYNSDEHKLDDWKAKMFSESGELLKKIIPMPAVDEL